MGMCVGAGMHLRGQIMLMSYTFVRGSESCTLKLSEQDREAVNVRGRSGEQKSEEGNLFQLAVYLQ